MRAGVLVLAATPIGSTNDASAHLVELLQDADVIAAEDTRRALALAGRLGVRLGGQLLSFHDHNEAERVPVLLERLRRGQSVVVISDAGMPGISDPGHRLVRAAIAAGLPVTCAPGPSAALTALVVSGLPTDRFAFEGFVPRRPAERDRALARLASETRTCIYFESPRRCAATLAAMAAAFGEQRPAAVCRELTKSHEEVRRGPLGELASWAAGGVLGEIVIVVGPGMGAIDVERVVAEALARVQAGERLRDVCSDLAPLTAIAARELYRLVLAAPKPAS